MVPVTLNNQKNNQTVNEIANCQVGACRLRVVVESGADECLMESVRSSWTNPKAENYCSDQSCRKFVGQFHTK